MYVNCKIASVHVAQVHKYVVGNRIVHITGWCTTDFCGSGGGCFRYTTPTAAAAATDIDARRFSEFAQIQIFMMCSRTIRDPAAAATVMHSTKWNKTIVGTVILHSLISIMFMKEKFIQVYVWKQCHNWLFIIT